MELPGFDYADIHALQEEVNALIGVPSEGNLAPLGLHPAEMSVVNIPEPVLKNSSAVRLAPWLLYRSDPLVRRSSALQDTQNYERLAAIAIHPSLAEKLSLSAGQRVVARQGDSEVTLPLRLDDRLAHDAVLFLRRCLKPRALVTPARL